MRVPLRNASSSSTVIEPSNGHRHEMNCGSCRSYAPFSFTNHFGPSSFGGGKSSDNTPGKKTTEETRAPNNAQAIGRNIFPSTPCNESSGM